MSFQETARSSTDPPAAPAEPPRWASYRQSGRSQGLGDILFRLVCQAAALLVVLLALLLAAVLVWRSWEAITTFGAAFFIHTKWDPVHKNFGAAAFVWGTVSTSLLAMLLAVPLGVGTAVYLAEIAPARVRQVGSFLVEMLAVVPSVVYGFWGLYVLAPFLQDVLTALGGPNLGGVGILPAGLILAIMIVPYIASVSFDVIRAVPRSQREGALALGSTRWQTIWEVVLPYARPGIVGGCFLALGRALGETMAVTMLIGNKAIISLSPFAKGNSIASVIANEFTEAGYDLYLSALVELGLVLLLVTVVFNSLARLLIRRVGRTGRRGFSSWGVLGALALGLLPAAVGLPALSEAAPGSPTVEVSAAVPWVLGGCLAVAAGWLGWRAWRASAEGERLWHAFSAWLCVGLLVGTAALAFGTWRAGGILDAARENVYGFGVGLAVLPALALMMQFLGGAVALFLTPGQLDALMTRVLGLCLTVTVGFLLLILGFLFVRGASSLDLAFFTQLPKGVGEQGGGMANALVGSVLLVGMATLFAVPVGVLAAIYLAEFRSPRLAPVVRFIGELLGGVPSIVIGLFAYYVVVLPLRLLTDNQVSFCAWAGAFALGVMMIPIVMRASEEALRMVPRSLREASYALGAGHWQTVRRVIVPAALPAIITAVFLGIARVAGETAPLLLTAGWNRYWPRSPNDFTPSLPYYIFAYAISAYDEWKRQAWAAALVLVVVVMVLNFGVRLAAGKRVIQASAAD
jgi:phosphate ABC transporter permease protein PstC/phosphate ABC transporter permease subunit PstA